MIFCDEMSRAFARFQTIASKLRHTGTVKVRKHQATICFKIMYLRQGCIRLKFLVSRFKMNFSKTESTQALTQNTF